MVSSARAAATDASVRMKQRASMWAVPVLVYQAGLERTVKNVGKISGYVLHMFKSSPFNPFKCIFNSMSWGLSWFRVPAEVPVLEWWPLSPRDWRLPVSLRLGRAPLQHQWVILLQCKHPMTMNVNKEHVQSIPSLFRVRWKTSRAIKQLL